MMPDAAVAADSLPNRSRPSGRWCGLVSQAEVISTFIAPLGRRLAKPFCRVLRAGQHSKAGVAGDEVEISVSVQDGEIHANGGGGHLAI